MHAYIICACTCGCWVRNWCVMGLWIQNDIWTNVYTARGYQITFRSVLSWSPLCWDAKKGENLTPIELSSIGVNILGWGGVGSWSLQLLPMSKISVYLGAKFFPWKPAGGQKAEKVAKGKMSFCFKEEIREIEMGKTSQTIINPVSRIFHIISLQRLFVSLNSAFYVNISPDNAFWGFAECVEAVFV